MSDNTLNVAGLEVSERTARMVEATTEVSTTAGVAVAKAVVLFAGFVRVAVWFIPVLFVYLALPTGDSRLIALAALMPVLPALFVTWGATLILRANRQIIRAYSAE